MTEDTKSLPPPDGTAMRTRTGRGIRSKDQIRSDRLRVIQLRMQHYSYKEISEMLGISISTIQSDVNAVRAEWKQARVDDYMAYINQELRRLDTTEKVAWEMLRDSARPSERKTVERIARAVTASYEDLQGMSDSEKEDMMISRIQEVTQGQRMDSKLLGQIIEIQKERRRLLGLYAPKRESLNIEQTVTVKGYKGVNPDDWPDPPKSIEGRVIK